MKRSQDVDFDALLDSLAVDPDRKPEHDAWADAAYDEDDVEDDDED